jgi:hypothetical protein
MLLCTLIPAPAFAAGTAATADVTTGAEFNAAIKSSDSNITINIMADIDGVSSGTISSNKTITVNGNGHNVGLAPGNSYFAKLNSSSTITANNLTIDGTGAIGTLSYGGGAIVTRSGNVNLDNVVIKNCTANGSGGGGAVAIQSSSYKINATNCSFIGNKAAASSGIGGALKGAVNLVNCTFYGNEARDDGGAVYTGAAGTITNCTIVNNVSGGSGGGVRNNSSSSGSQSQIKNNIIIGNTAESADEGNDVYRANDQGYNLIGGAVNLSVTNANTRTGVTNTGWLDAGAPKDNGRNGLTTIPTIALLPVQESPAINSGTPTGAPAADARGFTRIGLPDIGAYEFAKVEAAASIKIGEVFDLSSVSPLAKGLFETVDVTIGDDTMPADGQSLLLFDEAGPERVKGLAAGTLTVNGYVGGVRFIEVEVTVEDEVYPDRVENVSITDMPAEAISDVRFELAYDIGLTGNAPADVELFLSLADGSPLPENIVLGEIDRSVPGKLGITLANEAGADGQYSDYELNARLVSAADFTKFDSREFTLKKPAQNAVVGVNASAAPRELKSGQSTVISYEVLSQSGAAGDPGLVWSYTAPDGIAVRGLENGKTTDSDRGSFTVEVKNRSASSGTITITAASSGNPARKAVIAVSVQGISKNVRSYDELYQALLAAEDGDVISVMADLTAKKVVQVDGMSSASINAASKSLQSAIALKRDVIIEGNGHSIDGGGYYAIFYGTAGTATLKNLTITNAVNTNTSSSEKQGVAIALKGGNIVMENVTIFGCSTSVGYGGALYLHEGSSARLVNCTIVNNKAKRGGGIYADNASVVLKNSIVYANRADDYADNLCYTYNSKAIDKIDGGHNIIYDIFYYGSSSSSRVDVTDSFAYHESGSTQNKNTLDVYSHEWLAGSLGNNGGGAKTLALLKSEGSPAIDKIPQGNAPERDERGISRDALSDIGAYEYYGVEGRYSLDIGERVLVDDDFQGDKDALTVIDSVSRWTTGNRSVATVESGYITGQRTGATVIRGYDASGSEVATFTVYVGGNAISSVSVAGDKSSVESGESLSVSYAVQGGDASDLGLVWTARLFSEDAWEQYGELPDDIYVLGLPSSTTAGAAEFPVSIINRTGEAAAISLTATSVADGTKSGEILVTAAPLTLDGVARATVVNIEQLHSRDSFASGEEIYVYYALPAALEQGGRFPFKWDVALSAPGDHSEEYAINGDAEIFIDTGNGYARAVSGSPVVTDAWFGILKIKAVNCKDETITVVLKGASEERDDGGEPVSTAGYHFNIEPPEPVEPDTDPPTTTEPGIDPPTTTKPGIDPPKTDEPNSSTPGAAKADLAGAQVSVAGRATWTGRQLRPAVKVKLGGKTLAAGKDYTVVYGANKSIGRGEVTVKGAGNYKGAKAAGFKILPQKVKLSKIKAAKGQLKITWKKANSAQKLTGFQIRYRVAGGKANGKWRSKTVSAKKTSLAIKGLAKGKKYQVQIRAYKKVKENAKQASYKSPWSAAKKSAAVKTI